MLKNLKQLTILFFIFIFAFQTIAFSDRADLKDLEKSLSECKTYDNYVDYINNIKKKIARDPNAKDADILYYMLAEARVKELAHLGERNDIESARFYMRVNEEHFNEALKNLDKAEDLTKSKELLLDITFLRFVIFKDRFHTQRAEALFNNIVNSVVSFSEDHAVNKVQLDRMASKLEAKGLEERALKLKVLYASRAGKEGAIQIADEIREEADFAFSSGDTKKADTLYKYYLDIGRATFDKNVMAERTLEIADEYYAKRRYMEALRYYEEYIREYPDAESQDYASYRVGMCLYFNKNYPEAIMQFETFLENNPKSKWFDAGFMSLSRAYYETKSLENGIKKLENLVDKYKGREICDYAELLTGLLYYLGEDYASAVKIFKNIQSEYPNTKYYYTTQVLIDDIKEIRKGDKPSFGAESDSTYKTWQSHTPIKATIEPKAMDSKNTASIKGTIEALRDMLKRESVAFADQNIDWGNEVEVLAKEGDVSLVPGSSEDKKEVNPGMALTRGDRIKTGSASSCDISFDNEAENVVGILENSDVILLLDRSRKLEVIDAHLFARLSSIPSGSTFEIKTPLAVCGARGTGFGVKGHKEATEASAYENKIFIQNAEGTEENIDEGFMRNVDRRGQISEASQASEIDTIKYQTWPTYIKVKPGQKVKFTLSEVKDLDKYAEYLYDKSDVSRLPKKVGDETEEDLLSVIWSGANGKFLDDKNLLERTWQAPTEPGTYTISVRIEDIGLVRPPDEGNRKESAIQVLTVVVMVENE